MSDRAFIGVVNPSQVTAGTGKNFKALKHIKFMYDVGREDVGLASFRMYEGAIYTGNVVTEGENAGKVRFNAVHQANGKYYNTPVFISATDLVEVKEDKNGALAFFDNIKSNIKNFNNKEKTASLVMLGLLFLLFIRKK